MTQLTQILSDLQDEVHKENKSLPRDWFRLTQLKEAIHDLLNHKENASRKLESWILQNRDVASMIPLEDGSTIRLASIVSQESEIANQLLKRFTSKNAHDASSVIVIPRKRSIYSSLEDLSVYFEEIGTSISRQDYIVCGFNLKRSAEAILADSKLMDSQLKELHSQFLALIEPDLDADKLDLHTYYDAQKGHLQHQLISKQAIKIPLAKKTMRLARWEAINTLSQHYYTHADINMMLVKSGLSTIDYVTDDQSQYAIYIIEKAQEWAAH